MSEIFLYTADAKLSAADVAALAKVGIIPVKVAHLDTVKRLAAPMPIPQGKLDTIALLALDGLNEAGHEVRRTFVGRLTAMLKASAIEARRAETQGGSVADESATAESRDAQGPTS